jgi:hypothetical protein
MVSILSILQICSLLILQNTSQAQYDPIKEYQCSVAFLGNVVNVSRSKICPKQFLGVSPRFITLPISLIPLLVGVPFMRNEFPSNG